MRSLVLAFVGLIATSSFSARSAEGGATFHPPTVPGTLATKEQRRIDKLVRVNPKPEYVQYNRELDRAVRGTPSVEKFLSYGFTMGDYRGGYPVRAYDAPAGYYDVKQTVRWQP